MTTNNLLLSLNRTTSRLDTLQTQVASGKKIQYASQDPIVAALALKFRTNVSETVQYQKNVKQATSWLEASEGGIDNTNDILDKIRELCVQGSSESYNIDDRKDISQAIDELSKQIITEANVTYAGRYVFGGYKTDQEVMFSEDNTDKYTITQEFTGDNIEVIKAAVPKTMPMAAEDVKEVQEVSRLQLAYTDVTAITNIAGLTIDASNTTTSTTADAYMVGDDDIKYISDTGEILLGKNVAATLKTSATAATPLAVTYTKNGFEAGDLNPQQYFDCVKYAADGVTVDKTFTKAAGVIEYEVGVNNKIQVNTEGSNVFTTELMQDLRDLVSTIDGLQIRTEQQIKDDLAAAGSTLTGDELTAKVKEIQTSEEQTYRKVMTSRLDAALSKIDTHLGVSSTAQSDIGSRINRLELIGNRLSDDKVNYTDLMNSNENVDYESAYIEYMSQQTIYNSALQVGAQIMQHSLVDYIR